MLARSNNHVAIGRHVLLQAVMHTCAGAVVPSVKVDEPVCTDQVHGGTELIEEVIHDAFPAPTGCLQLAGH